MARGRRVELDVLLTQPISGSFNPLLNIDLGGEQAASDLGGTETAQHLECEGHAGLGRHGLMATNEKQAKRFVANLVRKMCFRRRIALGVVRQAG